MNKQRQLPDSGLKYDLALAEINPIGNVNIIILYIPVTTNNHLK